MKQYDALKCKIKGAVYSPIGFRIAPLSYHLISNLNPNDITLLPDINILEL